MLKLVEKYGDEETRDFKDFATKFVYSKRDPVQVIINQAKKREKDLYDKKGFKVPEKKKEETEK